MLISLFLYACNNKHKIDTGDTGDPESFSYQQLSDTAKLIAEMKWKDAKIKYNNHLSRINIYLSKNDLINESEARKLINVTSMYYATSLTREARTILNGDCESKHSDLNDIKKELDALLAQISSQKIEFNSDEAKLVKQRIEKHNEILLFISNIRSQSMPTSLDKDYDISYNVTKLAKKREYENENFSCNRIKTGLIEVPRSLNDRHVAYINELVNIYNELEAKTKSDYVKIVGYFDNYCYNGSGSYLSYGISNSIAEKQVKQWMKISKPEGLVNNFNE